MRVNTLTVSTKTCLTQQKMMLVFAFLFSGLIGVKAEIVAGNNSPMTICKNDDWTDRAPIITTNDTLFIPENSTGIIHDVDAIDEDSEAAGTLTYSIIGFMDDAAFTIQAQTGEITFNLLPNYEDPQDVNLDNVYDFEVQVCDTEALCTQQSIQITVLDVDEDSDGVTGLEEPDDEDPCVPGLYNLPSADCDNDGLTNREEDANGNGICDANETCADNPDMDGDGIHDGTEVASGSDPFDSCDPNPYALPSGDCDGDGLTNGEEDINGNGVCDGGETCADDPSNCSLAESNFDIDDNALFRSNVAIEGNLCLYGQLLQPSDRKLKENIQAMENSLEQLDKINPVTYTFKREAYQNLQLPEGIQHGVIAQELATIFPNFVTENQVVGDSSFSIKAVDYNKLIPVLVGAIKELKADLKKKEQEISDLNERHAGKMDAIEGRLRKLEKE